MTLLPGKILRFKGRNADLNCSEVERELHGRCKRNGNSLEITKSVKLNVDRNGSTPFEIVAAAEHV